MTKTIWQAFYHYLYLSFRRIDANIDINLLTDADANTDTNIRVAMVICQFRCIPTYRLFATRPQGTVYGQRGLDSTVSLKTDIKIVLKDPIHKD